MKTKKYFIIPMLALLAYGCQDDEKSTIQPAVGEEVKFGATLHDGVSKTIYGPEANNAFPIYWVNGDEVIVSSPQCADKGGVGSATYRVSVGGAAQNYATSMDKTGEIGLRWGENPTGDFYSIYPASGEHATLGSDYHTVTITMPAQQDNNFVTENGTKQAIRPDMDACFMYAKTADVTSGDVVNLKYKPLSTAVRFVVTGPENGEVTINYIRIFAPEGTNINGTYSVDLSKATENSLPKMTATKGLNYVTFNVANQNSHEYLTLENGERYEVNAFLLLEGDTEITNEWRIEIGTSAGISYTKYLDGAAADGKNKILKPGMVHRLPDLPPLSESPEWKAENWMANLQRNVYLSEISIPGSWNSLNTDYQNNYTIQEQYNAGVRAFHIDTRWNATREIGFFEWIYTITDLGIANGGNTYDVTGDDGKEGKCMDGSPTFESVLTQITDEVKDDEYMVVMCTFAQGSTVHGDWRQAISNACANNDKVIMASELTENTVVGDVLGKVIVIVNTFTDGEVKGSKCLFFNMGMTLDESDWSDLNNPDKYYKAPLTWYNSIESGIMIYGTHAQITTDGDNGYTDEDRGYVPSFAQREQMIINILNWSKENYSDIENYAHNAWIYLGLGGYIPGTGFLNPDDPGTVGEHFNNWIYNIVYGMETNNSYYPIGIVLMNHANANSHVANAILMMNNKYRKAYDPDRSPIDGAYINGSGSRVQSAAPGYSSGMTDHSTDAIGWVKSR